MTDHPPAAALRLAQRVLLGLLILALPLLLSGDVRAQGQSRPSPRDAGPLSPEEALAGFELEAGYRIVLAAAEPLVQDPVAIAFDERGRMYVAESRGYPGPLEGAPQTAAEGVIVLL